MISNNTLSDIGDALKLKMQLSVRGSINLTGFTDNVEGITPDRFFNKTFRYSKNNLKWSNWQDLTDENIQKIDGYIAGLLFFEIIYKRTGTDTTGILSFNSLEIDGDIELQILNNTETSESIFAKLAENETLTLETANNLLRKIYFHGILPEYIERGTDVDDEDFIALWGAVCFFVSLFITFTERFDNIFEDRDLLVAFIEQSGIAVSSQETTLSDLQYIASHSKEEIRKRGTVNIIKEKDSLTSYGEKIKIRGELLRVLCKNHYDEFLFEVMEKTKMGFFVGQSSPLYNGTNHSSQLNKTEENTEEFVDIDKYDTFGNVDIQDGDLRIFTDTYSGIGFPTKVDLIPTDVDVEKLITVDKGMDYEITFLIKTDELEDGLTAQFGILGYNRNGIYKQLGFKDKNGQIKNTFFSTNSIQNIAPILGDYYFVRCIVFAENSIIPDGDVLNIGKGNNLKFNEKQDVQKLKICINVENGGGAGRYFSIRDLKMRPLIRGKNILQLSTENGEPYVKNPQFLQQGVRILSWMKNNNEDYTNLEMFNYIENFLIPYQQSITGVMLDAMVGDKQLLT